jgi:hypothetical protein
MESLDLSEDNQSIEISISKTVKWSTEENTRILDHKKETCMFWK